MLRQRHGRAAGDACACQRCRCCDVRRPYAAVQASKKTAKAVLEEYSSRAAAGLELPDLTSLLRMYDERVPAVPGTFLYATPAMPPPPGGAVPCHVVVVRKLCVGVAVRQCVCCHCARLSCRLPRVCAAAMCKLDVRPVVREPVVDDFAGPAASASFADPDVPLEAEALPSYGFGAGVVGVQRVARHSGRGKASRLSQVTLGI
jgi:hypothetical protein